MRDHSAPRGRAPRAPLRDAHRDDAHERDPHPHRAGHVVRADERARRARRRDRVRNRWRATRELRAPVRASRGRRRRRVRQDGMRRRRGIPDKATYRQRFMRCGRCESCFRGEGHGPYWYAYWNEEGRTRTAYVGRELPEFDEGGPHASWTVTTIDGRRVTAAFARGIAKKTKQVLLPFLTSKPPARRARARATIG